MPTTSFYTELGTCALSWSSGGITHFRLPEPSPLHGASDDPPPDWVGDVILAVQEHLRTGARDLSRVPLDLRGVAEFRQRVYQALRQVPAGQTCSYGELAARAGSPGAAQAVGQAMAKNPLPVLVPCHRVLAARGKGGFSAYGGLATKSRLLALEGVRLG